MNDEIKEILDIMKKCYDLKDENFDNYITLYQLGLLLDYITNLQQENEELKKNQRYYKNGVFSLEYDKETLYDMVDDYKSRIDKAIEYIKENCSYEEDTKYCYDDLCSSDVNNLLNILQNGSDTSE